MQNNSEKINRYLHDEMDATERTSFEMQCKTDPELQEELRVQEAIMKAIENAGIKETFSKAINKKIIQNRIFTWGGIMVAGMAMLILFTYLQNNSSKPASNETLANRPISDTSLPLVNPPQPSINVPFSEYRFEAEKGETIYHPSGSVIEFPPSSLLDDNGNQVKGPVIILYREFADPLDFFVSGIPMQYDSAGKKYQFESSGMCEILAYQHNKALFVNPDAKPEIHLSGNNADPLHNLYFLDTIKRSWAFTGKDIITRLKESPASNNKISTDQIDLPVKPVKPGKASDDRQAFSIEVAPGSFEELLVYDKLKFEVIDESNYRRSDAEEQWENVQLKHTDREGIYHVIFSNARRKVSYKVRPVLEDSDYDAALEIFNKKQAAYDQSLKNRLDKYQRETDSVSILTTKLKKNAAADEAWNEKINTLVIARNKRVRQIKQSLLSAWEKNQALDTIRRQDQFMLLSKQQLIRFADKALENEVMRSFSINQFGVWNCDHPEFPANEIPISATYLDSLGNKVMLQSVAVVYRKFNGIIQFPVQMPIRVIPGQGNMLWGILDSSFYYYSYNDFAASGIDRNIKAFSFKLRKANKTVRSYEEIRQLVDNM